MSIASLCSVHEVWVLEQTTTTGDSMGVKRTYTAARKLSCRVVPKDAAKVVQMGQQGQVITHDIYFTTDPGLTERERLQWTPTDGNTTVFRIVRVPTNPHGQNRMWILGAQARTEDNPVPVEIA